MFLALIPIAFLLHYFIFKPRTGDRRLAVLLAALMMGVYVAAITEGLSAFRAVTRAGIAIAWTAVCVVAIIALWKLKPQQKLHTVSQSAEPDEYPGTEVEAKWLARGVEVLIAIVTITAIASAPNLWDAMEYHLPRVSMWMSNHSVALFPTPDYAHLIFAPWAEFSMMHTYLLWGSDRFVNFVQLCSFIGCIVGVSYAAKLLGAGRWGQLLAAVTAAAIPEGVLEASGPMNIYTVSFWILLTVIFLLRFNAEPNWTNAMLVGIAAGLAVLTKGSAYVYLPFLVLGCWLAGNFKARIEFWKKSPVFLFFIFLLNGPQFWRCYKLTGSPLGMPFPDGGPRLSWMAAAFGARELIASVIRNISLHTVTPSAGVNAVLLRGIRALIRLVGADPDDSRAVWRGFKFDLNHFSTHEIHAGNSFHLLLVFACAILLLMNYRRLSQKKEVVILAASLLGSFLTFCALLRWQIWGARHHLPLFVLAAALCGLLLERFASKRLSTAAVAILLAYGLTLGLVNRTRSLIPWSRVADVYKPRAMQYFADQHEEQAPTVIALADAVNQLPCRNLAFDAYTGKRSSDLRSEIYPFFIYPVFALTHVDGFTRTGQYVDVDNFSAQYAAAVPKATPCAVICLDCTKAPAKWEEYKKNWVAAQVFGRDVVFSERKNQL